MEKILYCPFCGADVQLIWTIDESDIVYYCSCDRCNAHGAEHVDPNIAIKNWNTRFCQSKIFTNKVNEKICKKLEK